jgi:hypothetical protein
MIIVSVVAAEASACYGKIRRGDVGRKQTDIRRRDVRDQRELEQRLSGGAGASQIMEHVEPVEGPF